MLNNNYDHNDNAFFQSFIVIIECIPYTQVLPPSLDFFKKKHFVPCRMHILFPSPTIPKHLVNLCILHKSSSVKVKHSFLLQFSTARSNCKSFSGSLSLYNVLYKKEMLILMYLVKGQLGLCTFAPEIACPREL